MKSFSDIIAAFGGVVPFREAMQLRDLNARQMKQRDSIPAGYWPKVVAAANERNIDGVTLSVLAELAQEKLKKAARSKADA